MSEAEEGQELRWRWRFLGISWCRGGTFYFFLDVYLDFPAVLL